jgi:hypothetical protein
MEHMLKDRRLPDNPETGYELACQFVDAPV